MGQKSTYSILIFTYRYNHSFIIKTGIKFVFVLTNRSIDCQYVHQN